MVLDCGTWRSAVHKPSRIIAKKGQKQVGKITSGERGKTVTILCSMNAHGRHIPPFMIFPRKKMNDHLFLGSPPGTVGVPMDSGWTDSAVFIKRMKHFVDHVKTTSAKKVVLFVDGHASHRHECDGWMVNNPGKRICFCSIAALLGGAFAKASTLDKGVASTSDATSPAIPTTRAKLPQAVTSTSDATSPASQTSRAKLTQAVASTSDATSPASPTTRAKLPHERRDISTE